MESRGCEDTASAAVPAYHDAKFETREPDSASTQSTTPTQFATKQDDDKELSAGSLNEEKESRSSATDEVTVHPQGAKLAIIVLALILNMFLVCLDQVGATCIHDIIGLAGLCLLTSNIDHSCNSYPKNYRRLPWP